MKDNDQLCIHPPIWTSVYKGKLARKTNQKKTDENTVLFHRTPRKNSRRKVIWGSKTIAIRMRMVKEPAAKSLGREKIPKKKKIIFIPPTHTSNVFNRPLSRRFLVSHVAPMRSGPSVQMHFAGEVLKWRSFLYIFLPILLMAGFSYFFSYVARIPWEILVEFFSFVCVLIFWGKNLCGDKKGNDGRAAIFFKEFV